MKKEKGFEQDGTVTDSHPNAMFTVTFENGHVVRAKLSGKISQNFIRIIKGDKVRVEISPYDLSQGRITYRHK